MNKSLKRLLLTIVLIVFMQALHAQVPPPPVGLPVDGGIVFLIISGLVYGVFKIKKD